MPMPTKEQVQELLDRLTSAWSAGDGSSFGASFTSNAHFVAFDGTVLSGPSAIGAYHQTAFDRHLQDTILEVSIEGTCEVGSSVLLVFFQGGIRSKAGKSILLTGESASTMVVVLKDGKAYGQAFQNTRKRPIVNPETAKIWSDFDDAWGQYLAGRE